MSDTPNSNGPDRPAATDPWGNPLPPEQQPAPPPQAWWPADPSAPGGAQPPYGQPPYGQPPYPQPPYGQPPYGQAPPGYGYGYQGPSRTEGTAIGALVCGLVGLLICGVILEPIAIVLGFTARKKIQASGGTLKGEALATVAIVLGCVGLVLAIIGFIVLAKNPDILNNIFSTTTTAKPG